MPAGIGADYEVNQAPKVLISPLLMGRAYQVSYPKGEVICREDPGPVSLMTKAILLCYLNNAREVSGKEKLVGFSELSSGSFIARLFPGG